MKKLTEFIADVEYPVLIFPVIVALTVAVTFLFPFGKCGLWQWWLSTALTLALIVRQKMPWRRCVRTTAFFLLMIAGLWLLANVMVDRVGWDELACHHPAIRMMMLGWNPVWGGAERGMIDFLGFNPQAAYHIMAAAKSVWYYSAAASFFTNAPFAVTSVLTPVLFMGLGSVFFSVFQNVRLSLRLLVLLLMYGVVALKEYSVDAVVAISAVGLFISMYDYIVNGNWNMARLVVFSFWMVTAKQIATLHCFAFWVLFVVFSLVKTRNFIIIKKSLLSGAVISAVFLIMSVSPYLTVYLEYGHPLYPVYTCDEKRYPPYNMTFDFLIRNDDAASMGRVGAWMNAFISSDLTRMYYKVKTGRHSFIPESRTWSQCFPGHSKGSPTTALFRLIFSTSLLFLAVFGGVGGRFVATGLVVGTFLLPVEMIGYVRYTPWIVELILAGVMMACANWMGRVDYVVMIPMAFFVAVKAPGFFLRRAEKIDNAYGINLVLSKSPPRTLVPEMWGWHFSDNLRLLKRQVPELACSEVVPEAEVRRRPSGEAAELEFFFGCGFKIPSGSAPIRYEDYHCVRERPSRKIFVLRSFFVTLPVNVWNSLKGLGSGK